MKGGFITSYYRICPACGAALDPGERCDCEQKNKERDRKNEEVMKRIRMEKGGQLRWAEMAS